MIRVSPELLEKYDRPGPRYTSYPTAPAWTADYGASEHARSLRAAGERSGEPLSIYVHLPFCESMCMYCGCSVIITQRREKGPAYVDRVVREAELVRELVGADRPVVQHHWGGGTPTFLPPDELERLFAGLGDAFPVADGAEVSIEVDPRVTTRAHLEALRRAGFNRISMGVQDFDPKVQTTIHRVQSFEQTRDLVAAARALEFESVNLDLVYGLPYQRVETFRETLGLVLEIAPDRIACYGYAHVPWLKKHQRVLPEAALPRGRDKLDLYLAALDAFGASGYEAIGMDHFAKRDDELAVAARQGALSRNFMGYTTRPAQDMLSFGITAISEVSGAFAQNGKSLAQWSEAIDAGRLAVERGLRRGADDEARRRIILDLMCRFRIDYDDHGGREAFAARYPRAVEGFAELAADGLIESDERGVAVTEVGKLFVRNLCMPFDAYLERQRAANKDLFSRTV
jgi:oxygen-independent coproporphyrinogen-3 oxidase